jgi:plasmid stabilization system protein ParE
LDHLLAYIQEEAGIEIAQRYFERVYEFCSRMDQMPERFPIWRPHVAPIRIAVFERSLSIAFEIRGSDVVILRALARGRDRETQLR